MPYNSILAPQGWCCHHIGPAQVNTPRSHYLDHPMSILGTCCGTLDLKVITWLEKKRWRIPASLRKRRWLSMSAFLIGRAFLHGNTTKLDHFFANVHTCTHCDQQTDMVCLSNSPKSSAAASGCCDAQEFLLLLFSPMKPTQTASCADTLQPEAHAFIFPQQAKYEQGYWTPKTMLRWTRNRIYLSFSVFCTQSCNQMSCLLATIFVS